MILEKLAAAAQERVAGLEKRKSFEAVREEAEQIYQKESVQAAGKGLFDRKWSFSENLRRPGLNYICECKKASPSKGLISSEFPYLDIARAYEKGGAAAISCLTEPDYFLGSDVYLEEIAQQVSLPVLRKDFTVSAYQVYEAKLLGAKAVLLICAILSPAQLQEYRLAAESVGLDALVETHDAAEIETALQSGAKLIGINNRNLQDFSVDINTCLQLRQEIPEDRICVAESGIRNETDIRCLKEKGFNAVLIGETLMRSGNPEQTLRQFREA
ncbi:MAG: indole-3-glycerol phosphate synthase TrpC [Acidaminococcaceae bacterium]|nr:indole-3-glycerol phosphate synthase TrpC [Acidaminococcaceae bacterium]